MITRIGPDDDDELARSLQSALHREADAVQPSDRFNDILDAVDADPKDAQLRRWRLIAVAAVLLLGLGIAVPFLLPKKSNPPASSPTTVVSMPTDSASLATQQRQLAIYYVDPHTNLLFREFRDLPTQIDALTTAVNAVLAVPTTDPDYVSFWRQGQVLSATVSGNVVTVDLSAAAFTNFTSEQNAANAINQMVYTATAAVGDDDANLTVRILRDGSPALPHTTQPDAGFARQGTTPLAPVFISRPGNLATVRAGEVAIEGYLAANAAPGPVVITNTATNQEVARTGVTPGTAVGGWRHWQVTFTLSTGKYLVSAASGNITDTKAFTVS